MNVTTKTKLILLLFLIGALFTSSSWIFWQFELHKVLTLHNARESDEIRIFENYLALINESQRLLTYDYSYWDDMVDFVTSGDPAWAKENLESSLDTFKIDGLWVLDPNFGTVYNIIKGEDDSLSTLELPLDMKKILAEKWFNHFFTYTPIGLLEIRTAPIQPSSDDPRTTKPQGFLVTGIVWNENHLQNISKATDSRLVIIPGNNVTSSGMIKRNETKEIAEGVVSFKTDLQDWLNNSIAQLHIDLKAEMYSELLSSMKRELYLYILFLIGLIILLSISSIFIIYRPLKKITESLKQDDPSLVKPMLEYRNEFGVLARLVTDSFDQRFLLSKEINERKHFEEALERERDQAHLYLDVAGVMIFVLDREGKIVQINRKGCDLLGYQEEEIVGRNWFAVCVPQDVCEEVKSVFNMLMAGNAETYEYYENPVLTKSGEQRLIAFHNTLLRDKSSRITGVLFSGEDISDRKRAEAQLIQAQKMESVGRLAGGVAHDFNNMLGVIIGHVEMALDQVDPAAPLYDDLIEIQKAAQRSADLTHQLLAFARKQTISPQVLDINDRVSSMLKMLQRLIGEDIDLVWKPKANLWMVKMDPTQIDQILANLSINARDAIAGVGKLTLETENVVIDKTRAAAYSDFVPGEYVLLTVSDTGCGMDKKILDNLFEPFFTTKKDGKGTGLGLATVYGIVRQNNGFIFVHSEQDQGTAFDIYIPRIQEVIDAKPVDIEQDPAHGAETILLVEDEEAILKLGKTILEKYGYTVLASETPGKAISIAERHQGMIHLLITDVVMPVMNGKDLKDKISTFWPEIKTIFISGYTANVIAEDGVWFLQKPFSVKTLAAKVREVLEQKKPKILDIHS